MVFATLILYLLKVRSIEVTLDGDVVRTIMRRFLFLAGGGMLWTIPTLIVHFGCTLEASTEVSMASSR